MATLVYTDMWNGFAIYSGPKPISLYTVSEHSSPSNGVKVTTEYRRTKRCCHLNPLIIALFSDNPDLYEFAVRTLHS